MYFSVLFTKPDAYALLTYTDTLKQDGRASDSIAFDSFGRVMYLFASGHLVSMLLPCEGVDTAKSPSALESERSILLQGEKVPNMWNLAFWEAEDRLVGWHRICYCMFNTTFNSTINHTAYVQQYIQNIPNLDD